MSATSIEWTDRTVNPIRARNRQTGNVGHYCEKISPGCANCYAATWNRLRRHGRKDGSTDSAGTGLDFVHRNRTEVDVYFDEAPLLAEARRKAPSKIFPCDMTDIFGDWVRDDWRTRMWDIMWAAPQHTWQVLTKRPEAMLRWVARHAARLEFDWCSLVHHPPMRHGQLFSMYNNSLRNNCGWYRHEICDHPAAEPDGNDDEESGGHPWCSCTECPIGSWVSDRPTLEAAGYWDEGVDTVLVDGVEELESRGNLDGSLIRLCSRPRDAFAPNVWLGCTIENQLQLRKRLRYLRSLRIVVPHAVIWLSIEPLVGPLDIADALQTVELSPGCGGSGPVRRRIVDWVVVGGESGPGARPMHPAWARNIICQCKEAGVAVFFKQWGENVPYEPSSQPPFWESQHGDLIDGHSLPLGLSEHEPIGGWWAPELDEVIYRRVGKARAGRLLDGVEYSEFPQPYAPA